MQCFLLILPMRCAFTQPANGMLNIQTYVNNLLLGCDLIIQFKFNGKITIMHNSSSHYGISFRKFKPLFSISAVTIVIKKSCKIHNG